VPAGSAWTDLLDPSRDEITAAAPVELFPIALDELAAPLDPVRPPRPAIEGHGEYVLAVLLLPVAVPAEDRLYYEEIDVIATARGALTVRKTPGDDPAFPADELQTICAPVADRPGPLLYRLLDEVGERYLGLVDALDGEIDELEDGIESWSYRRVRERIAELRHEMLRVRQTLTPTRDAVRRIVDGRLEIEGQDAFPRDLRISFGDAYDKLLRASEGLDVSRDLLAGARDYHQAKIAETQNDVVKKLTVIASLLLFPTFVVGVYGQNFEHLPELGWHLGYAFSWCVIVVTTILQLAFFKWRRWI